MTLFETGLILTCLSLWALVIIALLGKISKDLEMIQTGVAATNRQGKK